MDGRSAVWDDRAMTADLPGHPDQVHEAAETVIAFWLGEVPAEKRFVRDSDIDRICRERFGATRAAVVDAHGTGWRAEPRTLLAAIILIDQFSRNIFRGSPDAYAADPLARALAGEGIAHGWGTGMTAEQRQFLHMPLMHSERMDDQVRSLALYRADGGLPYDFARLHAGQVARFGRFPQRNDVLGRESTAAERAFLSEPGNEF